MAMGLDNISKRVQVGRLKKSKVIEEQESKGTEYIELLLTDPVYIQKCRDLTGRELDIMRLIWSGYRMCEISRILDISERTVEYHRYNIMKKYRVDNTVQMLRIALAKKVIELTEAER